MMVCVVQLVDLAALVRIHATVMIVYLMLTSIIGDTVSAIADFTAWTAHIG